MDFKPTDSGLESNARSSAFKALIEPEKRVFLVSFVLHSDYLRSVLSV